MTEKQLWLIFLAAVFSPVWIASLFHLWRAIRGASYHEETTTDWFRDHMG